MTDCSVPCLACAVAGAPLRVLSVDGDDALARRLSDLGLWPGTAIELMRRTPMGGPLLFWVRGYRLALRREEALRVRTVAAGPRP